jgi:hypothetical protein
MGMPMKNIYLVFFLTLIAICLPLSAGAEMFLPVGPPEYQFIYDAARREEISSGQFRLSHNISPYILKEASDENPLFIFAGDLSEDKIRSFLFLSEDCRAARYSNLHAYESMRGGLMGMPFRQFSFYTSFVLDEKLAKSPAYSGKKWNDLAGEIENSFISYNNQHIDIMLGRFGSNWGPVNQSLVLSSTARPMDALAVRLRWGRFLISFQTGQLDKLKSLDSNNYVENRFFAGHRLDIKLSNNLNLGLFETIIYGGENRTWELAYLNPLMFFHSIQLNDDSDDNTFLGVDFSYYLANRHKFYGQLLIDDYQIEEKSAGDNEPNEFGYQIGFQTINLLCSIDFEAEYLKIANRTFDQKWARNRYLNRGELIGNDFGNDGDRLCLSAIRWFKNSARLSINFTYQRRGEGDYSVPWTEPWLDSNTDFHESFPSGTIEKMISGSIKYSGFIGRIAYLDAESGIESYHNYGHIAGDKRTVPFFSARLTFLFSTDVNIR